jgi:hypothetical protein
MVDKQKVKGVVREERLLIVQPSGQFNWLMINTNKMSGATFYYGKSPEAQK